MAMVDLLKRLEGLLNREAIRHCLMRYSRAIERVDEALLREVYWPEAIDNHGSYNGSADGFISWVIPMLGTMTQTAHFLGNILIEVENNCARCETYFIAFHRLTGPHGEPKEIHVIGRYLDRMEKRSDEWRLLLRNVAYDGVMEVDHPVDWAKRTFDLDYESHRFPDDVSYQIFSDGRLHPPQVP